MLNEGLRRSVTPQLTQETWNGGSHVVPWRPGFPEERDGRDEEEAITADQERKEVIGNGLKGHGVSAHIVPMSSSCFLILSYSYIGCSHWETG